MAGEGTKRIIDLTEAAETQSGDYIAIDSTGRGTRKLPAGFMATAEDLSEEQTARQTADATLDGKITTETQARIAADNEIGEQITALDEKTEADAALIQNPTKTLSGALVSFTDGAEMPMVACAASIVPKQSGSGTPSPSNVRPISGWESVSVNVSGKNIFDKSVMAKNWYITGSNTIGNGGTCLLFSVPIGTAFTVSGTNGSRNRLLASDKPYNELAVGDALTSLSNTNLPLHLTSQYRTYIYYCETSFNQAIADSIQVEIGNTATDYAPYNGHTTTTPLGRTVYGGTLDVVTGVLTVTHVYQLFNGSEVWDKMNTSARQTWRSYLATGLDYAGGEMITNEIEVNRTSEGSDPDKLTCRGTTYTSRSFYIFAPLSMFATVDDLKTWLASNPLQVCYELATPQTYTLTGQEVNTLLGDNNVWADSGDVEITYRRDISIVINNLESALNG